MPSTQVHSNQGFINGSNATASTSNNALVDAGTGVFADTLTLPTATAANGLYFMNVHETTGLDIHFAMTGALATTGTARIMRCIPLQTAANGNPTQWTFRHLCDVDLTASAQTGVASGTTVVAQRWATCAITAGMDGGLLPAGTRTPNGKTTNAAGSLFIDPISAKQVIVQVKIGTCTDIVALPSNWTRN